MVKELLDLSGKENKIYEELAKVLEPHKDDPQLSNEFVVEGTLQKPIISIRYPAKKLFKLTPKRKNCAEYGNLYDFFVIIYDEKGQEVTGFNYRNIALDFDTHKKNNEEFWELLKEVYYRKPLSKEPPKLQEM